jgi:uncharacterized Zn finger protein (UPF0148 family)
MQEKETNKKRRPVYMFLTDAEIAPKGGMWFWGLAEALEEGFGEKAFDRNLGFRIGCAYRPQKRLGKALRKIARMVEDGSYIEFRRDGDELWRHAFEGGGFCETRVGIAPPRPEEEGEPRECGFCGAQMKPGTVSHVHGHMFGCDECGTWFCERCSDRKRGMVGYRVMREKDMELCPGCMDAEETKWREEKEKAGLEKEKQKRRNRALKRRLDKQAAKMKSTWIIVSDVRIDPKEGVWAGEVNDAFDLALRDTVVDECRGDNIEIDRFHRMTGYEERALRRAAPLVEDGSYIEFRKEGDELWRYVFEGGGYREERVGIWTPGHRDDVGEIRECGFCGTRIGEDACSHTHGTMAQCESCETWFCEKCLEDRHGKEAFRTGDHPAFCPDCLPREKRIRGDARKGRRVLLGSYSHRGQA